ncbi:hypothetical protein, partial [Salmonella enterica]|uniref:hypothetical protein n=1 Tax=Salmonella enterica TaxID=28901 RepID=UPI0019D5ADDA
MSLARLRSASKLPPARVELLAYLLVITRCVEVDGAERAPLPSGAMWAAATAPGSAPSTPNVRSSASRSSSSDSSVHAQHVSME